MGRRWYLSVISPDGTPNEDLQALTMLVKEDIVRTCAHGKVLLDTDTIHIERTDEGEISIYYTLNEPEQ